VTSGDPRRTGVAALLARHRPLDDEAAGHLRVIREHVAAAAYPFDRSGFAPGHLTASGFVADPGGERVLMILHGTIGAWLQPGGHVDPGDDGPAAAAIREVEEETGVLGIVPIGEGLLDVDVHRHPGKPGREPPHLHLDLRFGFRAGTEDLAPTDEVDEARWVPFSRLGDLGVDRSVTRAAGALARLVRPGSP